MRKKKLFTLLTIMVFHFVSFGQSDPQTILQQAEDAYSNRKYSLAVEQFNLYNQFISQHPDIGKSQLTVDSMLQYAFIDSYLELDDWENAKKQIGVFYLYFEKSKSPLYFRVREKELMVDRKMNEEDALYQNAIQNRSSSKIYDYLDDYPKGRYRNVLQDSLKVYLEYSMWRVCNRDNSVKCCKIVVNDYPEGKYADSAKIVLDNIEEQDYQSIVTNFRRETMTRFLEEFPQSKYYEDVRNRYKNSLYYGAIQGDFVSLEQLKTLFPGDPKVYVADSLNQTFYIEKGDFNYDHKNYHIAIKYYEDYLKQYPNGFYRDYAASRLKKNRFNARLFSPKSTDDYDYWYFMFNMDTDPSFGFTISKLTSDKINFYYNFRIRRFNTDTLVVQSNGSHNSTYDLIEPAGNVQQQLLGVSVGINYNPVEYPIWFYAAFGVGDYRQTSKYACYNKNIRNGSYEFKGYNYYNHGAAESKLYAEIGAMTTIADAFTVKYGVMYNGKFVHQFGVGIMFCKDAMDNIIDVFFPDSCFDPCFNGCVNCLIPGLL